MKTPSNSLDRALTVLEIIEQTPGGLTSGEICRTLQIPKSSYSYMMTRLKAKGYVTRDERTGRYKVGLTPLVLAYGTLREMGFRSLTEPTLYRLASATGLAVSIGVLERGRVLLVDRVESPQFVRDAVEFANHSGKIALTSRIRVRRDRDIGRELPAHSNALGKVLLASLPRAQVLAIIAQEGLPRMTPHTIVSRARLVSELDAVRTQGYAISNQEQYVNVRGIGAPLVDANGTVTAAVSATGDPTKPIWKDPAELIELVRAAGREISRSMRL